MRHGILETIGYLEDEAEERIAVFLARPATSLIDIRLTPYSRFWPDWNKPVLKARYGRQYAHLRGLGNASYQDRNQPIHLLSPDVHIQHLADQLLRGHSYLLLCACKHYERCHRKIVYERILLAMGAQARASGARASTGILVAHSLWDH